MDDQVAIAAITIIPPTLAIVLTSIRGQRSRQAHADVAEAKLEKNEQKLDGIHVLVNGRLDEALTRIKHLEEKLNLEPGAAIGLTSVVKDAIDIREDK